MKYLKFFLIFLSLNAFCQKVLPFDTLKLRQATDLLADDYGNVYLGKNADFSVTKYDSLGAEAGKMMLAVPYKVQSVQNPLSIVLFSENAQKLKFVDQNLNEIQTIDFSKKFGFISAAYAEDLQQIWLLDSSQKRLVQYNFRSDDEIASWPLDIDFDEILDMCVQEKRLYLLYRNRFVVQDFNDKKVFDTKIKDGRRLRRENDNIDVICRGKIFRFSAGNRLSEIFNDENAKIVEKNSTAFFVLKGGKLYLYRSKLTNQSGRDKP